MSEYSGFRTGKLKLKGQKDGGKKSKKDKKRKREDDDDDRDVKVDLQDAEDHGNWFVTSKLEQITGLVCLEYSPFQYIRSLDNGLLILGAPHRPGEEPDEEEIFMAIKASTNQIAFKSGFGKYLTIDSKDRIVGRSDAIGLREQFSPIFQDGNLAILAENQNFLSVDEQNEDLPLLVAKSGSVGLAEKLKIRININPEQTRLEKIQQSIPKEERAGSMMDCEINYVRKYQSFQDKKMRLNKESTQKLNKAKNDGILHEALLDRRSKMKSDKFCK